MQAIDPVASVSRATGKQAWPTRHKRVTLTVRQDDPPGTTELFTSWATCAVFFWLSLFSLNMSQAWHGQCMCFATGCPQTSEARRWTYGCNSTDTRIEHGFLHGVRRPMALALLFLTAEQFFIKTSWSYSTSPSQERLARRLFSCRSYGCRGTRRPRRCQQQRRCYSRRQGNEHLHEASRDIDTKDEETTPVGRASIWSHL